MEPNENLRQARKCCARQAEIDELNSRVEIWATHLPCKAKKQPKETLDIYLIYLRLIILDTIKCRRSH